jgi:hypothetical protein
MASLIRRAAAAGAVWPKSNERDIGLRLGDPRHSSRIEIDNIDQGRGVALSR